MTINTNFPINERVLADLNSLWKEYEQFSLVEVDYNKSHITKYLRDTPPLKCRFCGKHYPTTTFKKVAHSVPDFIGNKSLFSKFECDSCNQYFSKFENEFANFMLPYNALGGVKNKSNKSPKYKQEIIVHNESDNQINIENFPDEISLNGKMIEFSLDVPTYIPDYVYRCLVKIGLTILPEDSLIDFEHTFRWLMDLSAETTYPGSMIFSVFPFESPTNTIRCVLLKAVKPTTREVPSTLLLLAYQNFTFQTFLPPSIAESTSQLYPFPHLIPSILDLNMNLYKKKSSAQINLFGKEKVKGEKTDIIIDILER